MCALGNMMRRIAPFLLILFFTSRAWAVVTCPSNVTTITPTETSCWPLQETSGTVITDTQSVNNGTISGTGYTLNQGGGIACNNANGSGCNISTATNYANPQPMSLYVDFVGTNGGMLQLGTSSSTSAVPYFALWLDTYGHLSFGVNNFSGTLNVLQSPQRYGDGNEHKALISLGSAGMKMYVDGNLVATTGVTLSSYANGYWLFGGINQANWPYGPTNNYFNGTLITVAWWNGTQFTDYQGKQVTGGIPTAITNNYCTFTNQIASLNPASAQAWANKKLTFQTTQLQVPGLGSTLPIAPSTIVCSTDGSGNIVTGCQIPQGAHVNLSVGYGNPIPLVIPASTSCDLTAILLSQTDPPEVVSQVLVTGGLFAGTIVTNPTPGQIGAATIAAPTTFVVNPGPTVTLDIQTNGNSQQVVMSNNTAITLSDWVSGAIFYIDTTENGTGSYSPTFSVPGGDTLSWSGGGGQPAMPSTLGNTNVVWSFQAISNTAIVGSLVGVAGGGFPLSATANANNYSITNLNDATFVALPGPTLTCTATCSGTCATTYTYSATDVGDNNSESTPGTQATCVNAASLSSSNHNQLTWTQDSRAHGGTNVYGRTSGSLGLMTTTSSGTFNDDGSVTPGASPPSYNSTGKISGTNLGWALASFGQNSTTGDFMPFQGVGDNATESVMQQPAPVSGTIHKMQCTGANTAVFTLRKNGVSTSLTCTISSNVCSDSAHAVSTVAGDLLDTQETTTGGIASCSYQLN